MLDNSLKRESIKAVGAVGAIVAGGSIAGILAVVLGVSVEALGLLGEKRTKELFDTEDLIAKVSKKIKSSDDFAGFVFSIWQKHNLESSAERRKMLKKFLEKEASKDNNNFTNFSKIEYIIQNISLSGLRLLQLFHSKNIYGRPVDLANEDNMSTNLEGICKVAEEVDFHMHSQDIEYHMNELCNLDLVAALHGRMDGTFYNHTKMGFILLDYIKES